MDSANAAQAMSGRDGDLSTYIMLQGEGAPKRKQRKAGKVLRAVGLKEE